MRTLTSRCPLQRNYRLNNKKLVDNAGFERRDLYMKPLNNTMTNYQYQLHVPLYQAELIARVCPCSHE